MPAAYPMELRERVAALFEEGFEPLEISRMMKLGVATVGRWKRAGDRPIKGPLRDRDPAPGRAAHRPRDPPHARAITPASEDPRVPPIAP